MERDTPASVISVSGVRTWVGTKCVRRLVGGGVDAMISFPPCSAID